MVGGINCISSNNCKCCCCSYSQQHYTSRVIDWRRNLDNGMAVGSSTVFLREDSMLRIHAFMQHLGECNDSPETTVSKGTYVNVRAEVPIGP